MRTHLLAAGVAALSFLPLIGRGGVEPGYFDLSVKPQDDFYRYVNGKWLDTVVIPPDLARFASFNKLQEDNWTKLHEIGDAAAAAKTPASDAERWVGDFYASGMDEAAINAAGAKPLQPELDRIAAIQNPTDVLRVLAHLNLIGVGRAGFIFSSGPDEKQSDMVLAQLAQGGLGLAATDAERDANRDAYLFDDEKSTALRDAYVAHMTKVFGLLGDATADAQAAAQSVLKLETALARSSLSRVQLRNPQATYHKIKYAQLADYTGDLDWKTYFAESKAPAFDEVNLSEPDFFKGFAAQLHETPVADWRNYLRWHLVRFASPFLSDAFADEHFRFFGGTMTGAAEAPPRWKRVLTTIDGAIGDALSQLYVEKYFPPASKARVLDLVANVRAALRARLQTLEWMDEPTRAKAVAKLDAFSVKIGYPDKWKDYHVAKISRDSYVQNVFRAQEQESLRVLGQIGHPVDKSEWHMTCPTVNAYYDPTENGITFPAGILQQPFFDAKADDAVNYGGIGVVIGHEMTHGFDDTGRQYDAKGNLSDWWTPESAERFKERAAAIVKQFSEYVAIDDVHLNGELTQGENIADLGGLRISYAALQKKLGDAPRDKIDGFTPEQRFFISHATVWRDTMRPAERLRRARVDPHAPGKWRVDGPLSNLDEFAKAFDVPEGAPMRRPTNERVLIW